MQNELNFHFYDEEFNGIIEYPTGLMYKNVSILAKVMTKVILKLYDCDSDIQFIVRGHSGSLIASSICAMLQEYGYEKLGIVISRKDEDVCHSQTMEGLRYDYDEMVTIIVDDFFETSDTLRKIIKDLKERCDFRDKIDLLLIGNHSDEIGAISDLLSMFKNIALKKRGEINR